ncbi:MAG: Ig-like domain-containing protein, partial [Nitrospirales bacterium]
TLSCSWTFSSGSPATSNDCTASGVTFPSVAPYDVTLTVSDGNGGTDTQTIHVTVRDTNTAPIISSNGGGVLGSVSVAEALSAVTTVTATDIDLPGDTLTYSLVGGADASRFSLNSSTGALTFKDTPDFEAPHDANTDNRYEVQVQVSDGNGGTDVQTLFVDVTNIVEAAPPLPEPPPSPEPEPELEPTPESEGEEIPETTTTASKPSPGPQGPVTPALLPDDPRTQTRSSAESENTFGVGHAAHNSFGDLSDSHLRELTSANVLGLSNSLSGPIRTFDLGKSASTVPIELSHQLDVLAEQLHETIQQNQADSEMVSGMTTGTGVTLSAGYVAWMLRGTSLLTSLFASLPAWGNFDPLPVLTGGYTAKKAEEQGNQSETKKENQEHQGLDEIFRDSDQD